MRMPRGGLFIWVRLLFDLLGPASYDVLEHSNVGSDNAHLSAFTALGLPSIALRFALVHRYMLVKCAFMRRWQAQHAELICQI